MDQPCCTLHLDGPAGTCCDPNDCGPCCAQCPTCPTLHNSQRSGRAYSRARDDRGETNGLVAAIILVLVVTVGMRLAFDTDPITWLDAAADWIVQVIREIARDDR